MVYGLWRILKCRNEAIFQGKEANPYAAVALMVGQVEEYRVVVPSKASLVNELPRPPDLCKAAQTLWQKPKHGMVQANCDGVWFEQTMLGGFGWVIRDFTS